MQNFSVDRSDGRLLFQTLFPIALLFWVKREINAGIAIPIHSFLLWCSIRVSGTENRGDK